MKATQMLLLAIAMIGFAHGLPLAGPSPEAADPVIPLSEGKSMVEEAVEKAKTVAKDAGESVDDAAKDAIKATEGLIAESLPEASKQIDAKGIDVEEPIAKEAKSIDSVEPEQAKKDEILPEAAAEIAPKIEENNEAAAPAPLEEATRSLPIDSAEPKAIDEDVSAGASEGLRKVDDAASAGIAETVAAKDEVKEEPSATLVEATAATEEKIEEPIKKEEEPANVSEYAARGVEESIEPVKDVAKETAAALEEAAPEALTAKAIEPASDNVAAKSGGLIEEGEKKLEEQQLEAEPAIEDKENESRSAIEGAKEAEVKSEAELGGSLDLEKEPINVEKKLEEDVSKLDAETGKIDSEEPAKLGTAEALTQTEQADKKLEGLATGEPVQAGVSPLNSSEESSEEEEKSSTVEKGAEKSEEEESSEEESQVKKIL